MLLLLSYGSKRGGVPPHRRMSPPLQRSEHPPISNLTVDAVRVVLTQVGIAPTISTSAGWRLDLLGYWAELTRSRLVLAFMCLMEGSMQIADYVVRY